MAMYGADIVLLHARIYTLHPQQPRVTALAIRGGRILAIGTDEEMEALREPGTQVSDLGGKTILPGLADAHLHLERYARSLREVDCETQELAECMARLKEQASRTPPGEWILGHGWSQEAWGRYGTLGELDAATPHHPTFLTAKSLHAAWANSLALQHACVGPGTPDPPGGVLQRTDVDSLTGILFESAVDLVARAIPAMAAGELAHHLRDAQARLHAHGVTSVHDFDGARSFEALQILRERGDLRLRVVKNIPIALLSHARDLGLRYGFGDEWLCIGGIKVFADGALGPRTASMLSPYEGEPQNWGLSLVDTEGLIEYGLMAMEGGFPLAVHAIGDRANHLVLDAFDALREHENRRGAPRLRHRIEHLQLIAAPDLPRPASLGLVASMQPFHATSDMTMADRWWGSRAALSYAWNRLRGLGVVLAFGSDAPVEPPNPFWGLHAAVTRRRQDGTPAPEGWFPDQRIGLLAALEAYTCGPAYAAGLENHLGRLAPGYRGDLLVLEEDPFDMDPHNLFRLQPAATMVGGEWVYRGGW